MGGVVTAAATTVSQINPAQLMALLGVDSLSVSPSSDGTRRTVRAEVSQVTLDSVMASYVYAATDDDRATDLRAKATAALTANDTFLALASPTNAQTLAQVQRLTRECNALIRLVIGKLDTTTGT